MRSAIARLAAFATCLFAPSALAASTDYVRVGYWNTDFGYLKVEERTDGEISLWLTSYDSKTPYALPIVMRTEANSIVFEWVDWLRDPASPKCETTRVGYETWGSGKLTPDGPTGFKGTWFTCDPEKGDVQFWRGVLVAGSHWGAGSGTPEPAPHRPYMDMSSDRASLLMEEGFPDAFPFDGMLSSSFDISCDGALDQIFAWTDTDDAGSLNLRIAIAYAEVRPGHQRYVDRLITSQLPASSSNEVGLCMRDGVLAPLRLDVAALDSPSRADLGLPASCRSVLIVAADDCRPIRYSMSFGSGGIRFPVAGWADE